VAAELFRAAARHAASTSYAPYSGLHVGAAGLGRHGVIVGTNLESAAYSLTVHAETAMLVTWRAGGAAPLTHVACCDERGAVLAPCGSCRQLLVEQLGASVLIAGVDGWVPLETLLPWHFGAADLPGVGR
jgi:cytidine deaminase